MMGVKMDGEELHTQHRKRFWRTLLIPGLGAAPIGFGVGWAASGKGDFDAFWSSPDWLILSLLGIAVATLGYGTWRFYKSIDEVELLDNIWASTAAYYAYVVLFPAWWVLGKAGITREPNHWLIFLLALGLGLVAYFVRKWQAR